MTYSPPSTHDAYSILSSRYQLSSCPPTLEEIDEETKKLINQVMPSTGAHPAWLCFREADTQPPITQESLAELDMPRIINNPKLRHDVNFDKELHFRPNLDGSKGKQKMAKADQYWRALEAEFVLYGQVQFGRAQSLENEAYWDRIMEASLKRLPSVFKAIQEILKTLVPDYDQKAVQERLDVDHIMQQIQNGVCDLIDLGNWLAKVLKNHCAPMRDSLVDGMQKEIRRGATENRAEKLVNGLRQLMTILEAMKLDVANHQIRHMRPLLIDDTINFQRRYNSHRIGLGKIDVDSAKTWLRREMDNLVTLNHNPTQLQALTSGMLRDLIYNPESSSSSSSRSSTPPTFYLDSDRLRTLRSDFHAQVYHSICREIMFQSSPISRINISAATSHAAASKLQRSLTSIVGATTLHRFPDKTENIAVEILRVMQRFLMPHDTTQHPFDSDLLYRIESRLRSTLHCGSDSFLECAEQLFSRLEPGLQRKVNDHRRFTAVDLQDMLAISTSGSSGTSSTSSSFSPSGATPTLISLSAIGAKLTPPGSSAPNNPFDSHSNPSDGQSTECFLDNETEEDLLRRLAHILVLHWQVWADLVYLSVEPTTLDHSPGRCETPASTPSSGVSPAGSRESLNGDGAVLSHAGSCTSLGFGGEREERSRLDERELFCGGQDGIWRSETEDEVDMSAADEDGDVEMSDRENSPQ